MFIQLYLIVFLQLNVLFSVGWEKSVKIKLCRFRVLVSEKLYTDSKGLETAPLGTAANSEFSTNIAFQAIQNISIIIINSPLKT